MNVVAYITSIFRGQSLDGALEHARQAGVQDARAVATAYVQGAESEISRILQESQARLTSSDQYIEADYEVQTDYESWSRPALMRECRNRGIATARTDTTEDLLERLNA